MSDIETKLRDQGEIEERLRLPVSESMFVRRSDMLRALFAERAEAADTIAALRKQVSDAVGEDYFGALVIKARQAAAKASVKFPQPNYVTLKIAEEAGEVVRGAVHFAEGRMDWSEVEGEIVQLLAMLIRFVTEGDQINGVFPPALLATLTGGKADA